MTFRNATRRFAATFVVFPLLLASGAAAQSTRESGTADRNGAPVPRGASGNEQGRPEERSAGQQSTTIGVPDDLIEPDLDAAVAAFIKARAWLDGTSLPELSDKASAVPMPGTRGVAVLLRHNGRLIAVGTDWPGGGSGDDRMLRRAVGRAIVRALGDRVISSLPEPVRDTAMRELSLELECAGRPEALVGRTFAECVSRLDPGLDGIAIRRGGGGKATWAATFPAVQYATNTASTPERTIFALLTELDLPLKDLPDLIRNDPIGVFKFQTMRLAQTSPQEMPLIRGRGAPRVIDADVTAERVRSFAMKAMRRLATSGAPPDSEAPPTTEDAGAPGASTGSASAGTGARAAEGSSAALGILGNYAPVPNEYKPLFAPPLEQALTAWAAASIAASERFTRAERDEARAFATRVLDELAVRSPGEESPTATIPPMAFTLCAVAKLGGEAETTELTRDLARVCREKLAEPLKSGSPVDRPLATLAAAMVLSAESRIASAGDTRTALDAVWTSAPPAELAPQLPWLVLAEMAYALNTGEQIAHAKDALALAELLMSVQAGFGASASEVDLRGGFRLTGASRGGVTSQSLRPGLGLVTMMSQPGFVPDADRSLVETRARALLRFMLELTIDEREAKFFPNADRAKDGVRTALWDSVEPVAANAMAILVAVEALEGVFHAPSAASTPPSAPTSGGAADSPTHGSVHPAEGLRAAPRPDPTPR
ncbi:MAG: hypothetical protein U0572_14255 [Phycisphaerales bacterium]